MQLLQLTLTVCAVEVRRTTEERFFFRFHLILRGSDGDENARSKTDGTKESVKRSLIAL